MPITNSSHYLCQDIVQSDDTRETAIFIYRQCKMGFALHKLFEQIDNAL